MTRTRVTPYAKNAVVQPVGRITVRRQIVKNPDTGEYREINDNLQLSLLSGTSYGPTGPQYVKIVEVETFANDW
jgi:hypothetical protein